MDSVKYEAFDFNEWFHKEYNPADLQLKQAGDEVVKMPVSTYINDLKTAFEAGRNSVLQSDDFDLLKMGIETSVEYFDKYTAAEVTLTASDKRKVELIHCIRRLIYALEGIDSFWPEAVEGKGEK